MRGRSLRVGTDQKVLSLLCYARLETDPLRTLLRRLHERGLLRALAVDEAPFCTPS